MEINLLTSELIFDERSIFFPFQKNNLIIIMMFWKYAVEKFVHEKKKKKFIGSFKLPQ